MLTRKVPQRPFPFEVVISNRRRQLQLLWGVTVALLSQPAGPESAAPKCLLMYVAWRFLHSHLHMNKNWVSQSYSWTTVSTMSPNHFPCVRRRLIRALSVPIGNCRSSASPVLLLCGHLSLLHLSFHHSFTGQTKSDATTPDRRG